MLPGTWYWRRTTIPRRTGLSEYSNVGSSTGRISNVVLQYYIVLLLR